MELYLTHESIARFQEYLAEILVGNVISLSHIGRL